MALPAGSLVVNSSQGGGSKDIWVLARADGLADSQPGRSGEPSAVLAGTDLTEPEADQPAGAGAPGLGARVYSYQTVGTPPDIGPSDTLYVLQQQQQPGQRRRPGHWPRHDRSRS